MTFDFVHSDLSFVNTITMTPSSCLPDTNTPSPRSTWTHPSGAKNASRSRFKPRSSWLSRMTRFFGSPSSCSCPHLLPSHPSSMPLLSHTIALISPPLLSSDLVGFHFAPNTHLSLRNLSPGQTQSGANRRHVLHRTALRAPDAARAERAHEHISA